MGFPQEQMWIFEVLDSFNRNHQIEAVVRQRKPGIEIGRLKSIAQYRRCVLFDIEAQDAETSFPEGCRKSAFAAWGINNRKIGLSALQSDCPIENGLLNRTKRFQIASPCLELRQDAALKIAAQARIAPQAVAPIPEKTAPRYSPQIASFVKISKTDEAITS